MPEKTRSNSGMRKARKKLPDWSEVPAVDPRKVWNRIDELKTEAGGGFIGSSHGIAATMNRERLKLKRQAKPWSHHSVQEFYYRAKKQNGWGSNGKGTAVPKKTRRKAVPKKATQRTSMKFAKYPIPGAGVQKAQEAAGRGLRVDGDRQDRQCPRDPVPDDEIQEPRRRVDRGVDQVLLLLIPAQDEEAVQGKEENLEATGEPADRNPEGRRPCLHQKQGVRHRQCAPCS